MADPTKYTPTYNFTAFQTQAPTSPMPAPRLDEQFDNISQSVNQTVDALGDIRRSDGRLRNGIVTPESLSSALNIGFTMAGQWTVGESYNGGDGVVHNQKFYVANVANIATLANAPDLDAATWSYLFSVDDLVVAGALSIPVVAGVGDGTTKTFTLPVAPASVNNVFAKVGVNVLSVNAYTVSGPSITLATAPAIGVAYEFRILSTIAVTELEQAVYDARDTAIAKAAEAAASASSAAGSASAASGSASAAASSANAANTSKTDAAASASAAAGSASAAATSATNASGSATSAGNSASAAAGSASAASTSATNASNSATSAASSQTAAANSASSASTSATNALASENAAEDAADRAEAAAAGVEFPVSYAPQTLTLAQQGRARANIGAGILAGFRNKIINGGFDLWQRGNNIVATSTGVYAADRWRIGTFTTASLGTATPGTSDVPGNPTSYIKITRTQAASVVNSVILQRIEDVKTLAGMAATLTFYAQLPLGKVLRAGITQIFGDAGSASVNTAVGNFVGTGVWEKYQFTIDVPPVLGKTVGGNSSLQVSIDETENFSSFTINLARVSLVEGDATAEEDPFSPRHIHQELELCRRYYYIPTAGTSAMFALGYARSASVFRALMSFPIQMRISTPTVINSPVSDMALHIGGFSGYASSVAFTAGFASLVMEFTVSGITQGHGGMVVKGSGSTFIAIDAEL
ncbi:hypothetical protein [Ochrobactrum sp. A-1]|uniref:hypothetical protein n=1 Tax=Ochrobactrum sp. A-1 TaxID=2920940 RepID=UPI001F0B5E84|nr:hypothetical protein [Ochrobactrum sp. A-1]